MSSLRLPDVEKLLAAHGFVFVRASGTSHRIYRNAAGHALCVAAHNRHQTFSRRELARLARDVARAQALAQREGSGHDAA